MSEEKRGFIPDGYTISAYIKESEEWNYPSLKFEYRPMVQHERAKIMERITNAKDAEASERVAHKIIAGRLSSWDLSSEENPVALSESNVSRLEMHLSGRLLDIVMGYEPDDTSDISSDDQEDTDSEN